MNDFNNERIHFFTKYKSLTLYFRKGDVWEMVETGTDYYIDPDTSLDHSSTSFASWLRLLHRGSLRAQPSVSWLSLWHPYLNRPTAAGTLSIFFLYTYLLPLFFRLYTGAALDWRLSWGSIYNTYCYCLQNMWVLHRWFFTDFLVTASFLTFLGLF